MNFCEPKLELNPCKNKVGIQCSDALHTTQAAMILASHLSSVEHFLEPDDVREKYLYRRGTEDP